MITLEEFKTRVEQHDLTSEYSDDHRVWQAGANDYRAICNLAEQLPRAEVVKIWNAQVDKKLSAGARQEFYWSL